MPRIGRRLVRLGRLSSVCFLVASASAADWPQFLGPERNGHSTETGLTSSFGASGPPVVWQREVGAGYSGPAVAGGRLILFHRVADEEIVECLEAATGTRRWRYAYATAYSDDFGKGDGPRATPEIAGQLVYALGAEGTLSCLRVADGAKVWQRRLQEDYPFARNFFGVGASPLVLGDLLVLDVGSRTAGILALDRRTGAERWKIAGPAASYASPVSAVVDGKRRVFFLTREGLVGVDPEAGRIEFRERWRSRSQASVNAATPLVVGNDVFVSASYNTGAARFRVSTDHVTKVWDGDNILSNHFVTSVYNEGALYGFDGRQETGTRLRCVDFKTGAALWTRDPFPCGPMIAADGKLIVLSEDGDLVLVQPNRASYRELARAHVLRGPCRAPTALADGHFYARDNKKLVCLDLRRPGK